MISFKKSYAEQLIQLAIALSLLRVDPENYLGLGWESQLAASLHDGGDGWQLELRAAPLTDYPYANRKAVMPLIEDLARFRETINPSYDVTAYLLNVQNGSNSGGVNTTTTSSPPNNTDHPAEHIETQRNLTTTLVDMTTSNLIYTSEHFQDDMFLNSDLFDDAPSILDQNLADLNDYGEMPFTSFNNLPLKDEPPALPLTEFEIRTARNRASTSFSSSGFGSIGSPESNYSASAVIDWNDYFNMKEELNEEEEEVDEVLEEEKENETEIKVKQEDVDENNNSTTTVTGDLDDDNDRELTTEVSHFFRSTSVRYCVEFY